MRHDRVHLAADQIGGEPRQQRILGIGPAELDRHVDLSVTFAPGGQLPRHLSVDVAGIVKAVAQLRDGFGALSGRAQPEEADHRVDTGRAAAHCARAARPSRRRTAEQRYEVTSSHMAK